MRNTAFLQQTDADEIVQCVSPTRDGGASHQNWNVMFAEAMTQLAKPLLN